MLGVYVGVAGPCRCPSAWPLSFFGIVGCPISDLHIFDLADVRHLSTIDFGHLPHRHGRRRRCGTPPHADKDRRTTRRRPLRISGIRKCRFRVGRVF